MITFRNFSTTLRNSKASSLLNIIGLAVAFACFYVIMIQVNYDLSFNKSIPNAKNIYGFETIYNNGNKYIAYMSRPLATTFLENNPSVETFGCEAGFNRGIKNLFETSDKKEFESRSSMITVEMLDILGFEIKSGSKEKFVEPNGLAISDKIAKKHSLQIGDVIKHIGSTQEFTIGIIFNSKLTKNSDWYNIDLFHNIGDTNINAWSESSYNYFVKLHEKTNIEDFYTQAKDSFKKIVISTGGTKEDAERSLSGMNLRLLNIEDSYFDTQSYEGNPGKKGNMISSYALLAVAILIVIIAFINFINFFFALVPLRIRSVNTRKIFGGSVFSIRINFIIEALILIFISLAISAVFVIIFSSWDIAKSVSTSIAFLDNIQIGVLTIAMAGILGLLCNIYPAYYITSFPTTLVLKGNFSASRSGKTLKYGLIGFQFVISIVLIIVAMFIKGQHNFVMNYDMGFNKSNIIALQIPRSIIEQPESRNAFSEKLKSNSLIKDIAYGNGSFIAPARMYWGRRVNEREVSFDVYPVSWNFLKFMEIEITEGRDFVEQDELKENGTFILNEQAMKEYQIDISNRLGGHAGKTDIVGVCKDFNFKPLQLGVSPFCFYVYGTKPWNQPNRIYIRKSPEATFNQISEFVINTIKEFDAKTRTDLIEIETFEQELGGNYQKEDRLSDLITLFAFLSIIIALMGVFGLVLFETQYRQVEIATRKVYGASVVDILKMLNNKFIKIIIICFVIASPIAYFAVSSYLDLFAYRMPIKIWIFAAALFVVLFITVTVVTIRSYKTATCNPASVIKK